MSALMILIPTLALALFGALAVLIAGLAGLPALALGAGFALAGGAVLLIQPFLGVAALATFSQLDAVEKLLFGFLPISFFKLTAAASVFAILANSLHYRDQIRRMLRNPVVVMGIVFLMLTLVSLAGAEDKALAVSAIQSSVSLVLLLILVVVLANSRRKVEILIWILVGSSLVSALILLVDVTLGVQLVAQSDAATTARTAEGVARSSGGSDYNPTTAASMLLVGVVFALVHAFESPVWRLRLLTIAGIGTIAVVFSFARSAALAYFVIALALVWRHRHWRYLPLGGFAVFLAGLSMLPFIPAEYWERLASIVGGAGDPTLGRRFTYNLIGIDLFLHHPIFGVGPSNFVHHFTNVEYRYLPGRTLLGRELHNMYLSVVVQYGIVGAFAFFGMLVMSIKQLRAVARSPSCDAMRVYAVALTYAFAAYLLASLFLPNEYTKYTWLLPGISAALYIVNEKERSDR
ncbi:O-antigen ligase family protein [Marivita sp. S2033]|uniref:O-antigen ligase family protein n=1 Tax=Marivita sp. S2033 TaxID=3373187 RepID=UPI003981F07A